ncbi:MAG: hypothetical protein R2717_03555 [Schumannella sp.]
MARPAFGGRRARSRAAQLSALGAVVAVVTAALAVLAGAVGPVLDAGAVQLVRQAGPDASAIRVDARLDEDAGGQDATMRNAIADSLRDTPAAVARSVSVTVTAVVAGEERAVLLLADEGVADHAELVAGDWPSGPGEVAPSALAAERLGVAVGGDILIGDTVLRITGTWRALDPADARWFGDPAIASGGEDDAVGPLLASEELLAGLPSDARVRWTLVPSDAALTAEALPGTADALARLDTAVRRMGGKAAASVQGDLPATLAHATRITALASGMLALPFALVATAGIVVLGLIGRSLAAGRSAEFLLLRARGASIRGLAFATAVETGAVSILGAAAGRGRGRHPRHGAARAGRTPGPPLAAVVIAVGTAIVAVALATGLAVAELRAPSPDAGTRAARRP